MFNKKTLLTLFAAASILGVATWISPWKAPQQAKVQTIYISQTSQVPELSCYPDRYSKPDQINKFTFDGAVYYEVHARLKEVAKDSPFKIFYFRTKLGECKFLNPHDQIGSRLLYMPKPVALHFSKLQFQPAFERCLKKNANSPNPKQRCIKLFEESINAPSEETSEGTDFFYPEDVEVLNNMGIKTDEALVITTPSDFEELERRRFEEYSNPKSVEEK
ncbi:hypothetical protein [Chlorogloea sp. CCALA 695]|uniref:hypothetical protein n=1 Tax=Chlorogloea sp. CCALA 695 TaxID=2107693 RepID=UPI000D0785C9|nr:hypothetical protein [Chlorogloea sp. CCALA 695]PSB23688.1 hypothetical protein C7B70_25725 [Chlorogloea sp. CCALA 695]